MENAQDFDSFFFEKLDDFVEVVLVEPVPVHRETVAGVRDSMFEVRWNKNQFVRKLFGDAAVGKFPFFLSSNVEGPREGGENVGVPFGDRASRTVVAKIKLFESTEPVLAVGRRL